MRAQWKCSSSAAVNSGAPSDHFRISFICTTLDARRGCCVKNPVLLLQMRIRKTNAHSISPASRTEKPDWELAVCESPFHCAAATVSERERWAAFEDRSSASFASVTTFCQLNCSIVYTPGNTIWVLLKETPVGVAPFLPVNCDANFLVLFRT